MKLQKGITVDFKGLKHTFHSRIIFEFLRKFIQKHVELKTITWDFWHFSPNEEYTVYLIHGLESMLSYKWPLL